MSKFRDLLLGEYLAAWERHINETPNDRARRYKREAEEERQRRLSMTPVVISPLEADEGEG